jgi:two-component system response regulator AtoC
VKVMVVEDDPDVSRAIARQLASSHDLEEASEPRAVLERLAAGTATWDVMLLDVGLPGVSGIEVLRQFRQAGSLTSIIMLTGDNTAATATECMRAGAFHYLTKPFRPYDLSAMVLSAARHTRLRRLVHGEQADVADTTDSRLVGTSAAMRKLRAALARLGSADTTILIQGESGTGKELVARALHERGRRRARRFVALNCGAFPESLIDSELFGHVKGAFTGATTDRGGVFVEADGGTLFLDEIGDMPLEVQARLLRVLQESEVRPVGGSGVRRVDVRVIAATHVDLAAAAAAGRFRHDLFYRLAVVPLVVPPLRERLDDLPLLAAHFLRKHGGSAPPVLTPEALDAMLTFDWPGNVRQLENSMMHAIAFHQGGSIGVDALPAYVVPRRPAPMQPWLAVDSGRIQPLTETKRQAIAAFERTYLVNVLRTTKGSTAAAARLAGIDRTNFRRLLQRHGIEAEDFKRPE